jgi:DNA-binding CsgD family transcriptional regulator
VFANRNAEALAEAAVTESLPAASPAEEVVVFGQLAMLASMLFRQDRMVAYSDRALRAAGDAPALALQALAVGASTGALAGLVADAAERLALADKHLAELGGYLFRPELTLARLVLDWLGGRWEAALEALPAATTELATHTPLASAVTAIELEIRTWRGELDLAARLAARAAPTTRNVASLHALALAGYLLARGEVGAARRTLDGAVDDPVFASYSCLLLGRRVELELDHGRPGDAEPALAVLAEVAADRVSPWSVTTLHRCIGRVRGDPAALARAVEAADTGGLVFEKARAQLASAGPDAGRPPRAAVDGLTEAYLTFHELGAHGLRRQAGGRLRELGAKVPRVRSRRPGLLTEAEDRVARLVQQGMRNRDIAAALHYSPRSVEVYLSRIYAKLGVSSRLELARALDARRDGP